MENRIVEERPDHRATALERMRRSDGAASAEAAAVHAAAAQVAATLYLAEQVAALQEPAWEALRRG